MPSKNHWEKIKNVIIVNDFDYIQGGASKVAIDTANLLVNGYPKINVYFFAGVHDNSSTLDSKVKLICTNQGEAMKDKNRLRGMLNGLYNFKAKKQFYNLLKKLDTKNTIIHVHGWTKSLSSSIYQIAFKMKFPVILTMHDYFTACPNGGYFNYQKNRICHLKPLTYQCIKCNCDSRNYAYKIYRVIRQFIQNKIVKLNDRLENVISISKFSENILKHSLNSKVKIYRVNNPIQINHNLKKVKYENNKYFLYVGRISKEKGVDIFCDALTKANLKGIVVGDGPEKTKLEKKYPNIQFVGWKTSSEVYNYFYGAKALIFPSRWYEGAPLTILEALSVGLPCIVSNSSAAIDFINENENGYIFKNVEELISILINFDLKKEIKLNYDEKYLINLINVYEKVNGGNQ